MLEGRRVRGREEKQSDSSVGGEDWRKYEMKRKGEVCVGVMVNRWDGGIRGRVGDVEGGKCGRKSCIRGWGGWRCLILSWHNVAAKLFSRSLWPVNLAVRLLRKQLKM